ncbi:4-hydroxybenzoate polyprenyltransferase [Breoghania corrubedonensis]|uniref:4-hydroxybenzoate polyprenyltransferase n=1 Tax=Breoghania corrubedonensis TaxID=665038 RepID=A0A2T5VD71_9HYPH|nr:UbiA family prenyltransferase [Breoghania corrubedonensis]PTW61684.1 4-hydroxybenzoate polyprenyltransferase [Breoghania corrubedonensis]
MEQQREKISRGELILSAREALGYSIVMMTALFSGYCSRAAIFKDAKLEIEVVTENKLYIGMLFGIALILFFMRAIILDPKDLDGLEDLKENKYVGYSSLFLYIPIVIACGFVFYASIDLYTGVYALAVLASVIFIWAKTSIEEKKSTPEQHFVWKIFFPALSICTGYFLIGWGAAGVSGSQLSILIIYLFLFTLIFVYVRKISYTIVPKLIAINLLLPSLLFVAYFFNFCENLSLGRPEFFLAMIWTLNVGVFEIIKQPKIFRDVKNHPESNSFQAYYVSGANWSVLLFLHSTAIYLFTFKSEIILVYVVVCISLALVWTFYEDKLESRLQNLMLISGFLVPTILLFIIYVQGISYPKEESFSYVPNTGNLATVIGLLITVFFVVYAENYAKFSKLYESNALFSQRNYCVMLIPVVLIVLMVFIFSALGISHLLYGDAPIRVVWNADAILTIFLIEMGVVFALSLWLRGMNDDSDGSGNLGSDSGPTPGQGNANNMNKNPLSPSSRGVSAFVRPATSSLAGALSVASFVSGGGSSPVQIFGAFLLSTLICMFGFAVNDIFDQDKDLVGRRYDKPLVSGLLSKPAALRITFGLFFAILVVGSVLDSHIFVLSIIGILALLGYSPIARSKPSIKGLYTALLTCIPFIIGYSLADSQVPFDFILILLVFITGREILIDLNDQEADMRASLRTIPVIIGRRESRFLSWALMIFAIGSGIFIVESNISRVVMAASLLALLTVAIFFRKSDSRAIGWSRIPMALSVVALFWA